MPKGAPGVPRASFEKFAPLLAERMISMISDFTGVTTPTRFRCDFCTHEWTSNLQNAAEGSKYGCPECGKLESAVARLRDHDEFSKECFQSLNIVPLESYQGAYEPIRFECQGCDLTWVSTPRAARACARCVPKGFKIAKLAGREVRVRGYEDLAINWILANTSIKAGEIIVDSDRTVPRIDYEDVDGRARYHRPDLWIPSRNLLVEVKSPATIGLVFYRGSVRSRGSLWRMQQRKAQAAIAAGYDYRLLIFNEKHERVIIPDWMNTSAKQARHHYRRL